jgi:hypothetical protein
MPDDRFDSQVDERARDRVRKRIEDLRGFYGHLGAYLTVMLALFLINMLAGPRVLWFLYPLVGWGVFVLMHGVTVFLGGPFGQRWEERKTRQLMEKEKQRSRWGPHPPRPHAP